MSEQAKRATVADMERRRDCNHFAADPHRDSVCPTCGRIVWAYSRTMSEALKQSYFEMLFPRNAKGATR